MWLNPNTPTTHCHNITTNNKYTSQFNNNDGPILYSQTPTTTTLFSNPADADANLDIDSETRSQTSSTSSSSPPSTFGTFPLSTFDSLAAPRTPRTPEDTLFPPTTPATQSQLLSPVNMMYRDHWAGDITFAPKGNGPSLHNRESSLSSLGSYGPASPFSFNSSNPHIAVHDSSDNYHNMHMSDDQSYQIAAKAPNSIPLDNYYANLPYSSESTTDYARMRAPQKQRGDRNVGGLLPPPEFSSGGSSNSRPGSVASSVASDSPATPAAPEPQEDTRRKVNGPHAVPKLDRTMTDVYSDELYNPNFCIPSAPASQPTQTSPTHEMFVQRVQAANNQHLSVTTQTPMSPTSRRRSPFRQGSPLAPTPAQDFPQGSPNMCFETAQQVRERKKAADDAVQILRQTIAHAPISATSQTISPQDALLEYNDADSSNNFPLFPPQQSSGFDANQISNAAPQANNFGGLSIDPATFDSYLKMANGLPLPQQYPFVSKPRVAPSLPSASNSSFSMSSRVGDSASASPETTLSTSPRRPERTGADGGTYTCTYHGCTQRFETPALLQKHKREGHRQAHGLNALRRPEGPTASYFNTQAGPHKCERINPSTGKPCNTVFSRPYDLTRHEDTIHNGRKQKVRCDVCTEEKTFSRADALTRHYRVCHPDLEFPGKHRKRGGAIN